MIEQVKKFNKLVTEITINIKTHTIQLKKYGMMQQIHEKRIKSQNIHAMMRAILTNIDII